MAQKSKGDLAEITVKALVLGVVLSVVLSASNAYLGLFAGMTVSASIPAAVISMGILRLFKKSNILENNIVQTAASAGESVAAGVIFTLPAMIILGSWDEFNYIWVTVIAGFGGILGVFFTIPLRRSLFSQKSLSFPEGVATAEVLEAGEHGRGIRYLVSAGIFGGLFKLGAKGVGLWPAVVEGAVRVGGGVAYFGSNLSPALLGVGYIVGFNIAVLVFAGGAINWFIAIPIFALGRQWAVYPQGHEMAGQALSAVEYAGRIWSAHTRYLGVGAMLVGGIWTLFHMRKSLFEGIAGGLKAYRTAESAAKLERTEKDIPMKWVLILIIASIMPLFVLYQIYVHQIHISLVMAVVMVVTGFLFSAVSAYMAGLVGSSNNPLSGLTIATIVVAALLLAAMMGKGAENGPPAAIIIASIVCCAGAIAGDNIMDLKTGQIVGATPYKQQIMQILGTVSAALVIGPILALLQKAYGFAGAAGAGIDALPAPQANLMASITRGVFGGQMPWGIVFVGMALAVGIIAFDCRLQMKGSGFRTPVLAVAVGMYLPFELSVPMLVGGLVHLCVKSVKAAGGVKEHGESKFASSNGLLFASGLITGEALMGIFLAIPVMILKKYDLNLPLWSLPYGALFGIGLIIAAAVWLYKISRQDLPD